MTREFRVREVGRSGAINWAAASAVVGVMVALATFGYQYQKDAAQKRDEAQKATVAVEATKQRIAQTRLQRCANFTMLGKQFWKHAVLFSQSLPSDQGTDAQKIDALGVQFARKALANIEEYERTIQLNCASLSIYDHDAFSEYYDNMYPTSRDIEHALRGQKASILRLQFMDKTGRHQKGLSFTSELEKHCRF